MYLHWGASFLVVNRIAKSKKLFTIGEELILPAAKVISHELLGDAEIQKAGMCSSLGEAEVQSWRVKQQTYWGQLLERD